MPQVEMCIRQCDECKNILPVIEVGVDKGKGQQGYVCCDEYFCDGKCLAKHKGISFEEWSSDHYEQRGDCYYSEWPMKDELLELYP